MPPNHIGRHGNRHERPTGNSPEFRLGPRRRRAKPPPLHRNPTRLAVLSTGSAEALAPASSVLRRCGRRLRRITARTSEAIARAVTTDHTPLTAESDLSPKRGSARKPVSARGNTTKLMTRLTTSTIRIGAADSANGGNCSLRWPCVSSAGSKLSAFAARSRMICSSTFAGVAKL